VSDINQPIELLRVIHSFDPCMSCSVHMVRPDGKAPPIVVDIRGSAL
jgi:hydrogenase large subunit